MKGWGKIKSIDSLSDRLGRLELEKEVKSIDSGHNNDDAGVPYATAEELEHMTAHEYYEARFNWRVKEVIAFLQIRGYAPT